MSEITTGSVPISIVSAPIAIGAACLGAAYFAAKFCVRQYEKMLKEVDEADARLKWLDKTFVTSPKQMVEQAHRLQRFVSDNNSFKQMTVNLSEPQKQILAGVIATEKSPLGRYVPALLAEMPESTGVFRKALDKAAKSLALDNFHLVNKVVADAASAAGFCERSVVIKQTEGTQFITFVDKHGRRLTAYCKINRDMNPSLALDLEGFACNSAECSRKMDEVVKYLHTHGVPFTYKRMKHNQPSGVLRKLVKRKLTSKGGNTVGDYLQSGALSSEQRTLHTGLGRRRS
jgi:hypothetical protein